MAGVTITPNTIGGQFTRLIAYFPAIVVTSQNGGRVTVAGFAGSGAPVAFDSFNTDNGSTSGIVGNWVALVSSQDQKIDPWAILGTGFGDFALGSCDPAIGEDNFFAQDTGPTPPSPATVNFVAYYSNDFFSGEVGPSQNAVRNSANWTCISSQPVLGEGDLGSVKCYPANQISFNTATSAISAFKTIRGYANTTSPMKPASATPNIHYEAAWDIFGNAHNTGGISLEIMFWTYNHNQGPYGFYLTETGIDLSGDGMLWDLYMTADTVATGGAATSYSYAIWYLQDAYQGDIQWVDILAGLRYVCINYVVTSNGAPANPLDCPLIQITRGWELCSTEYTPMEFRMNDYRVIME